MERGKKQKKIGSVIAHDMVITGDVTFEGKLAVEGVITGTLAGEQVELGRSGAIEGEIRVKLFNCSGRASGVISAECITINKSATISGNIAANELDMVPGSVFSGEMTITPDISVKNINERFEPLGQEAFSETDDFSQSMKIRTDNSIKESSALDGLADALAGGSCLVIVISEDVTARRAFCEDLQNRLEESYHQLVIKEPTGSFREMLVSVAAGFNVDVSDYSDQDSIIEDLSVVMTGSGQYLLLVDNVEKMYPATLERMITYLVGKDSQSSALTKLVLFGGTELHKMLDFEDSQFLVREPDCVFVL